MALEAQKVGINKEENNMALKREIEMENGVILNYHRIVAVNSITNIKSIIEVASYISEKQREKEARYIELQLKQNRTEEDERELEKGINVLVETKYYDMPYSEENSIENAYEYLKTLDDFKNAQDV